MTTVAKTKRISDASPLLKARMAGVFWLIVIVSGSLAMLGGNLGFVANLIASVCYIAATLLVYDLLKPVNRSISFLAAVISLVGCALGVGSLFRFAPVIAMGGAKISFLCFGLHCLLVGYLILQSTFLPRFVGVLMVLGGLGWLTLGVSSLLSPTLARARSPYILFPGILGEASLTLWLLVVGVNVQRWHEQANAVAQRRSPQATHAS